MHIFYKKPSITHLLLAYYCCSYLALFADFSKIATDTNAELQLADHQVTDALQALSVRYENAQNKTTLTTQTDTISTGAIKKIVCGWFPDTSSHSCPDTSSSVEVSSFNACLVQDYPNQLGCEVQFKSHTEHNGIPGALNAKKVLFIAQGPGLYGSDIKKSSTSWQDSNGNEAYTPTDMAFISSFSCYNPAGSTGDGINNGGPLGTFALCDNNDCSNANAQITLYPLDLTLQPGAPLGGLASCLTQEALSS